MYVFQKLSIGIEIYNEDVHFSKFRWDTCVMISVLQIVKYSSRIVIFRSQDELMNNAVYHMGWFSLLCIRHPNQIFLFSSSWCAHPFIFHFNNPDTFTYHLASLYSMCRSPKWFGT